MSKLKNPNAKPTRYSVAEKKKKAKPKPVKWTQAEDFFIQCKVMDYNDKELAEILGKTEKQVIKHIKELGIDIDQLMKDKMHENSLKGFAVGSGGDADGGKKLSDRQNIISATGGRTEADDRFEKQNGSGGVQYLEQFKTNNATRGK